MSDVTTPRSLRLTDTMDIDTTGGTLVTISGVEAVRQAVRIRLQTLLGEWFLDQSKGTPWFQSILGKNRSPAVLKTIFLQRVKGTVGVNQVPSLVLSLDRTARTLSVSFSATCDFGQFDDTVALSLGKNP